MAPKKPKTEKAILRVVESHPDGVGTTGSQAPPIDSVAPLEINFSHIRKAGRPPKFSLAQQGDAYAAYLAGDSTKEIAEALSCTARTVRNWIAKGGWQRDLAERRETVQGLEAQILRLSRKANLTNAQAQRLAMLTKALERLKKIAPKPKPRPIVANAVSADLLAKVMTADYGLYEYQVEFLKDESRFRLVLKARQIGFSYVVALAILLGAMAGRPQIVVSASERQAQIILNYVRFHAGKLGVILEADKSNLLRVGGQDIIAVSTNFRTAQGWPGDVWFDEFAWVRQQRMLWAAIVPSITAVGGRVTVFSTPFLPGSLFWEIATNHRGKYDYFSTRTITIHDALAQGMPLPGGLDELRMLFDSDAWAMFYECQWAEDGSALLPWQLLHELTAKTIDPALYGRIGGGVDVGRINDRTAIALVGQRADIGRDKWRDEYALVHHEMHSQLPFDDQRRVIEAVDQRWDVDRWKVDKTGLGMQLAEELSRDHPERFEGVWFSAQRKAKLALNLLKLCEDKKLVISNDPDVLAQLHSVKKVISGESIKYDADRTEDGHGDLFWAIALAADGRSGRSMGGGGLGVEVLS